MTNIRLSRGPVIIVENNTFSPIEKEEVARRKRLVSSNIYKLYIYLYILYKPSTSPS